jgi:hypothetical protein
VVYFKVLSRYLPGGTEEKDVKFCQDSRFRTIKGQKTKIARRRRGRTYCSESRRIINEFFQFIFL